MSRQIAIDIECSPRTDEPEFDEPAGAWETFAVSLSFRPEFGASPTTTVFVRDASTDHALRKLLAAVANWVRDRLPVDCFLSFNGHNFDFPILVSHIEEVCEGYDQPFAEFVRESLDHPHRDLFREIVDNQADHIKWPSLESALAKRDIPTTVTKMGDELVEGATMPEFGEKILNGEGLSPRERSALMEYAASDVRPLHALADRLDRERVASEEAEMVTMTGEKRTGGYYD